MENQNHNNPTNSEKRSTDSEEVFREIMTIVNIVAVLLIISWFIWPDWIPSVFGPKIMQRGTLKALGGIWLILNIWAKKK